MVGAVVAGAGVVVVVVGAGAVVVDVVVPGSATTAAENVPAVAKPRTTRPPMRNRFTTRKV
jgi:hypothetical protein